MAQPPPIMASSPIVTHTDATTVLLLIPTLSPRISEAPCMTHSPMCWEPPTGLSAEARVDAAVRPYVGPV